MIRLIGLLVVLSGSVHGQVHYRIFEKNHCDGSIRQLFQFCAYKDTSYILISDLLTSEIIFNDTGVYKVSHIEYFGGLKNYSDFHSAYIDGKSSVVSDTIESGLIDERTYMYDPPFTEYYCCDKKCDGEFVSSYNNGQIQMTGRFRDGQPIGTLTQYYLNGKAKRIETRRGKRIFGQYFLSNGSLHKSYTTRRIKGGNIIVESKSYAVGNKLSSHTLNNRERLKKKWTYDSQGQVVEYRKFNLLKQYNEKGKLVLKAKRTRPFRFDNLCTDYFKFWRKNNYCLRMWQFEDFKFKVITWDNGIKKKRTAEYFAVEDQFFFPNNFDYPDYEKD
jgi:antitoxin component YwqK of YwqJK toxin-antitoxin module